MSCVALLDFACLLYVNIEYQTAASAVSFDALQPAGSSAAAVAASHSLSAADSYADRRAPAQADDEEGKEEAVER